MKKSVLTAFLLLVAFSATAKDVSYLEEVQSLGAVAGQGLACFWRVRLWFPKRHPMRHRRRA